MIICLIFASRRLFVFIPAPALTVYAVAKEVPEKALAKFSDNFPSEGP